MSENTDTERLDALDKAMRVNRIYVDDGASAVSVYPEGDDVDGDEQSYDTFRAAADAILKAR